MRIFARLLGAHAMCVPVKTGVRVRSQEPLRKVAGLDKDLTGRDIEKNNLFFNFNF